MYNIGVLTKCELVAIGCFIISDNFKIHIDVTDPNLARIIWRTRLRTIRTAQIVKVSIVVPAYEFIPLYAKLSRKANELHTLGMDTTAISRSLKVCQRTVRRALKYKKQSKH